MLENLQQDCRAVAVAKTLEDRAAACKHLEGWIATAGEVLKRLTEQGTQHDLGLMQLEHDLIAHTALAKASLEQIQRGWK